MEEMLVSVIVPAYKVERYLPDCIGSIRQQTYRNLQIILIDDGSPDGCGQICDASAGEDSRIQVIHQPNGGVGAARNAGLEAAGGEYICFVDGDDMIEKNMVECVVKELEDGPYDLCAWGAKEIFEDGSFQYSGRWRKMSFHFPTEAEKARFFCRWFFTSRTGWGGCQRIFRRRIIEQFGIRFGTAAFAEDMDFTFRYLFHCQSFSLLPDPLYIYRIHSNSAMRTIARPKQVEHFLSLIQRQKAELYRKMPLKKFYIYEAVAISFFMGEPRDGITLRQRARELLDYLKRCEGWEELRADAHLTVQDQSSVRKYCGPPYSELVLAFCQFILDEDEKRFTKNVRTYDCFFRIKLVKERLLGSGDR